MSKRQPIKLSDYEKQLREDITEIKIDLARQGHISSSDRQKLTQLLKK